MQATGYTSSEKSGTAYHKSRRTRDKQRNADTKADNIAKCHGNDFLTVTLHKIASQIVTRDTGNGKVNLITEQNYRYLLDSATNYAGLLDKQLSHNPGKSIGEGISNLYDELNAIIGKKQHLNIETNGNRLVFCVYEHHEWDNFTFFWLPVKFIESLQGQLKRIAISFICEFSKSNGLTCLYDSEEVDFIFEHLYEYLTEEGWDKDDREKCSKLFDEYTGGNIMQLLKQVDTKSYYKNLRVAIHRYKPQNRWEQTLIDLFKEGLQFIGKDKPSIMNYSYDPQYDEEADWRPVQLDKIVRVIYDFDDWVWQYIMDWLNAELRESYDISPVTTLELSPETDALFSKDDYPERFCKWFNEITNFLISEKL